MKLAFAVIGLFVASLAGTAALAQPVDCEPARCAVQAALDQQCPCTEATNHGRYVSCVARVVNRLARDGVIPRNCKGKIRRCAARSTCGKPDFVACHVPTSTCDLSAGTCTDDATVACATDLDCGSRCSIKRAERCEARGGVEGASGMCCADCVAP